jgi:hypothetical protein
VVLVPDLICAEVPLGFVDGQKKVPGKCHPCRYGFNHVQIEVIIPGWPGMMGIYPWVLHGPTLPLEPCQTTHEGYLESPLFLK